MIRRMNTAGAAALALAAALAATGPAHAAIVPFTEGFDASSSNWVDSANGPLQWLATGGPAGAGDGYASGQFNFSASAAGDTPTILRAQDNFDSSGDAFVGDWLADGVSELSFMVRHDAPVPLNFFTRFSSPINFPGAIGLEFAPVAPNTWTEISIAIDPSNPQFISFEGSDFNSVFSNIGNLQFGVDTPASLAGTDALFTFDIDNVSLVPAPGVLVTMLVGIAGARRRRRRLDS